MVEGPGCVTSFENSLRKFLFEPLYLLKFLNHPQLCTLEEERGSQKISLEKVFLKPFKRAITWFLMPLLTCVSPPPPHSEGGGLLPLMSKDRPFDVINTFQISFVYLCLFKSYLGIPALSENSVSFYTSNSICQFNLSV